MASESRAATLPALQPTADTRQQQLSRHPAMRLAMLFSNDDPDSDLKDNPKTCMKPLQPLIVSRSTGKVGVAGSSQHLNSLAVNIDWRSSMQLWPAWLLVSTLSTATAGAAKSRRASHVVANHRCDPTPPSVCSVLPIATRLAPEGLRFTEAARLQAARRSKAIGTMILGRAGPLTQYLHRRLGNKHGLSNSLKKAIWTDGFKMDWQGSLHGLPAADHLTLADLGHIRTRDMFNRFRVLHLANQTLQSLLMHIPMQRCWFDCALLYPAVRLGTMAVMHGYTMFLMHLLANELVTVAKLDKAPKVARIGGRVLDLAASCGHLGIVQLLTSKGARASKKAVDLAARGGHLATGHLHVVEWMLAHGAAQFTHNAVGRAKTDAIAALLVASLNPEDATRCKCPIFLAVFVASDPPTTKHHDSSG
ncbi:hypothetical protein BC831DRAFT_477376 [Entophlyctis helioformis]|nr:hypothetical protein BC831DRAFT_482473 [Entophlyctis helioformis]KAI8919530.1 hypothetical protein BC831DRAFT_481572 [Entophlyctis helioformis]KAI8920736.1 hypothetical protein BC831DRAFT_477376 [Entophlyctis helioformis]